MQYALPQYFCLLRELIAEIAVVVALEVVEILEVDDLPLPLHFVLRFVEQQLMHFFIFANGENVDVVC